MAAAPQRALLCKPGSDGGLGDCPFTHYVMMTLALKDALKDVKVQPCAKDDKPAWLLEKHAGSLPCLVSDLESGEGAVCDSGAIAKFVDETCGEPNLLSSDSEKAFEATSSLFGAIAKFIKNTDESQDEARKAALDEQLGVLEAFLASGGGIGDKPLPRTWLGNEKPCLADASVAPKLYVLQTAGGHYKQWVLAAAKFPSLAEYMARAFAHPAFASTRPRDSEILHGWGQARGGGH